MGQSVDKIITIIIRLRVCTSKNKYIDPGGRETCDYERDLISLLCDSTMSNALNFCFKCTLLKLKRKINHKNKNVYMLNQNYFDLPKITVDRACTTKN